MANHISTAIRNAMANAYEATVGASPILRLYTGSAPTNLTDSASGTKICEMTLPSDFLSAASSGAAAKLGTWSGVGIGGGGSAGYFRIYASDGTTPHHQGTVTATGGGGDATVDNVSIATDQVVTVTSFSFGVGNA